MNTGRYGDLAVLIYFLTLVLFAGSNLVKQFNLLDLLYLFIVIYGIFKYAFTICSNRK